MASRARLAVYATFSWPVLCLLGLHARAFLALAGAPAALAGAGLRRSRPPARAARAGRLAAGLPAGARRRLHRHRLAVPARGRGRRLRRRPGARPGRPGRAEPRQYRQLEQRPACCAADLLFRRASGTVWWCDAYLLCWKGTKGARPGGRRPGAAAAAHARVPRRPRPGRAHLCDPLRRRHCLVARRCVPRLQHPARAWHATCSGMAACILQFQAEKYKVSWRVSATLTVLAQAYSPT